MAGRNFFSVDVELLDDTSLHQNYKRGTVGQVIFDSVCRTLEVLENEYFGLQFVSNGEYLWVDVNKALDKQLKVPTAHPVRLEFRVKFYVRNPSQLQDEYTRYLFSLQIKKDILKRRLECNHSAAARLFAATVQAECGDYDPVEHLPGYISNFKFVPDQTTQLEDDIAAHHRSWCQGLLPAECDLRFLDYARRLSWYGVQRWPLAAQGGLALEMAVSFEGISVIHCSIRLNTFSWSVIDRFSYENKLFFLTLACQSEMSTPDILMFRFRNRILCKSFWKFVVEYHTFFRRESAGPRRRKRDRLFRFGSTFRYSGRTQSQIIRHLRQSNSSFLRSGKSSSFRRFSSVRLQRERSSRKSAKNKDAKNHISDSSLQPEKQEPAKPDEDVSITNERRELEETGAATGPQTWEKNESWPQEDASDVSVIGPWAHIREESPHHKHDRETRINKTPRKEDEPPAQSKENVSNLNSSVKAFTTVDEEHGKRATSLQRPEALQTSKVEKHEGTDSDRTLTENGEGTASETFTVRSVVNLVNKTSDPCSTDTSADSLDEDEHKEVRNLKRRLSRRAKKKPKTKSFFIAQELRDTERSYMADLDILNVKFRNAILLANALTAQQMTELFGHLENLQEFHAQLTVELENRISLWEGRSNQHNAEDYSYIGDIMRKRMAFMKLYTPYVVSQAQKLSLLQQWADENATFRDVYHKFESKQCHLPLLEFFNRPMQRMMQYKLLLERLLRTYDTSNADYTDTKVALQLVTEAAEHTNHQCKAADNAKKLVELQNDLSGIDNIVQPGRWLIREGRLLKFGRSGPQPRLFFLFNDILMYASPRPIGFQAHVKMVIPLYESRAEFCDDSGPYGENAFAVYTPTKSFVAIARSVNERNLWVGDINQAIEDILQNRRSFSEAVSSLPSRASSAELDEIPSNDVIAAPVLMPPEAFTQCQVCRKEFTFMRRKHHCPGCGKIMCSTCLSRQAPLPHEQNKVRRVCLSCYDRFHIPDESQAHSIGVHAQMTTFATRPVVSPQHMVEMRQRKEEPAEEQTNTELPSPSTEIIAAEDDAVRPLSNHHGDTRSSTISSMGKSMESITSDTSEVFSGRLRHPPEGLSRPRAYTGDLWFSPHRESANGDDEQGVAQWRRSRSMHQKRRRQLSSQESILDNPTILKSISNQMSGTLMCKLSQSNSFHRWQRMWVVLTSYSLFFYKSHMESNLIRSLPLPDYEVSAVGQEDGPLCDLQFAFKLTSDTHEHFFIADSQHTADRWIEVISNCIAAPAGSTSDTPRASLSVFT